MISLSPLTMSFFQSGPKFLRVTKSQSTFSSLALYNKFSVAFTFLKVGCKVFWCDFCCFKEKWIEKEDMFGLWDLKSWCVCVYETHVHKKRLHFLSCGVWDPTPHYLNRNHMLCLSPLNFVFKIPSRRLRMFSGCCWYPDPCHVCAWVAWP